MLSDLLQAPNGGTQSFLEGTFNPMAANGGMTKRILGHLSNDDTNAMRRTCSTMNNELMYLKENGIFVHRQEDMRDICDVRGTDDIHQTDYSCPNGINSSARLRRCTRQGRERYFHRRQW